MGERMAQDKQARDAVAYTNGLPLPPKAMTHLLLLTMGGDKFRMVPVAVAPGFEGCRQYATGLHGAEEGRVLAVIDPDVVGPSLTMCWPGPEAYGHALPSDMVLEVCKARDCVAVWRDNGFGPEVGWARVVAWGWFPTDNAIPVLALNRSLGARPKERGQYVITHVPSALAFPVYPDTQSQGEQVLKAYLRAMRHEPQDVQDALCKPIPANKLQGTITLAQYRLWRLWRRFVGLSGTVLPREVWGTRG